tara:strand:+ start:17716 stop:17952 length:237 start_codon:yes stop_codon:yes gene_type:complete
MTSAKFKGFYAKVENKGQFSDSLPAFVCNETETHYKVIPVKFRMGKFKPEFYMDSKKGMVLKSRVSGNYQSKKEAYEA